MRTVTFQSLLDKVARGRDMGAADVPAAVLANHVNALNAALDFAWDFAPWPELVRSAERTVTSGLVPWVEVGLDDIGTVHAVYLDDPDTVRNPRPVSWRFDTNGEGIRVFDVTGSTVWVACKVRIPEWTDEAWDVATDYEAADTVWHAATGECYEALTSRTGVTPGSDPTKWAVLEVPWLFRQAAARGALAVLSGDAGQRATEQLLEGSMERLLLRVLDQVRAAAGQTQRMVVSVQ